MKRFELKVIVANVLEIDPELLSAEVDLDTFENFDSVHVLMLVLELEQQAGVIMTSEEASKLRFYGDIERIAERRGVMLAD
jgi:acyl carrier protein